MGGKKDYGTKKLTQSHNGGRLGYENRYQRDFAEQIWVHRRTADSNPGLPAAELIWIYHMFYQQRQSPQVS
jgi:hypothetical protein